MGGGRGRAIDIQVQAQPGHCIDVGAFGRQQLQGAEGPRGAHTGRHRREAPAPAEQAASSDRRGCGPLQAASRHGAARLQAQREQGGAHAPGCTRLCRRWRRRAAACRGRPAGPAPTGCRPGSASGSAAWPGLRRCGEGPCQAASRPAGRRGTQGAAFAAAGCRRSPHCPCRRAWGLDSRSAANTGVRTYTWTAQAGRREAGGARRSLTHHWPRAPRDPAAPGPPWRPRNPSRRRFGHEGA